MNIRLILFVVALVLILSGEWGSSEAKPIDPYACMTDTECEEAFGFVPQHLEAD